MCRAGRLYVVDVDLCAPSTDNQQSCVDETLHTMHTNLKGKQGFMALKLDMSKAYDRLEWGFLEGVMARMGFHSQWIRLIQRCIRSVSYSIIINGRPYGHIQPSCGIRQGDPLSPYLFILCAEALSALLHQAEHTGAITGVPIARGRVRINHLFFADDSLLFCKANPVEWERLHQLLVQYESASGLRLNKEKTSIFFSRNTPANIRCQLLSAAGVQATNCLEKYLGLPAVVGRSRRLAFSSLKDRIWARISSWRNKFLSQAGKEILIKAVAQAIPTYTMSVFLLPKTLLRDINAMLQRYWWSHHEKEKGIHWVKWERMRISKSKGGLGFRDLECFNKALLAKQCWRILQQPDSLPAKIFRAKYFLHGSFLNAPVGRRPSLVWKSLCAARSLLQQGLQWRVGNGEQIRLGKDKWIPGSSAPLPVHSSGGLTNESRVAALIDWNTKSWRAHLVHDLFGATTAEVVCQLPLSSFANVDRPFWPFSASGEFTVRSAYHLHKQYQADAVGESSGQGSLGSLWKNIWKLQVPHAVRVFMWRACSNALATKDKLFRRGITTDPLCPICEGMRESTGHILWGCPAAKEVWSQCCGRFQKRSVESDMFAHIVLHLMGCLDQSEMELFSIVARQIWFSRNAKIHGRSRPSSTAIVVSAVQSLKEFQDANYNVVALPTVSHPGPLRWQPPPLGFVKINWDAALDREHCRMGMGLVVRNHVGEVLASVFAPKGCTTDPEIAEATAALRAATLCHDLGLQKVILEGDAIRIVRALNTEGTHWSRYSHITEEARSLLSCLQSWQVVHVKRQFNGVAHSLAKLGLSSREEVLLQEVIPDCILNLVSQERCT